MRVLPLLIGCGVLGMTLGVFAAPPTKEVVIGPDSSVKLYKDNVFLAAPDKQFRPIAELLDAAEKGKLKGAGIQCATRVYKGVSSKDNPDYKGSHFIQGSYERDLLDGQEECVRAIQSKAREIGQAAGLLNSKTAWIKDSHVFDPRVYERAKKMVGAATTKKKEGK